MKVYLDWGEIKGVDLTSEKLDPKNFKDTDTVLICSYNYLISNVETLNEIDFFFVVLDEGHLIKNPRNKTAKATKKLKARHKFLLSGTPI